MSRPFQGATTAWFYLGCLPVWENSTWRRHFTSAIWSQHRSVVWTKVV